MELPIDSECILLSLYKKIHDATNFILLAS